MPTVVCSKCGTKFLWKAGETTAVCPRGHKLTLREVRFTTEKEGEFYP